MIVGDDGVAHARGALPGDDQIPWSGATAFMAEAGTPSPAPDMSDIAERPEWELVSPVVPDVPPEELAGEDAAL